MGGFSRQLREGLKGIIFTVGKTGSGGSTSAKERDQVSRCCVGGFFLKPDRHGFFIERVLDLVPAVVSNPASLSHPETQL